MREVIAAIREGLPDADRMQPGQVFQHVLEALRDCSKKFEQLPIRDIATNRALASYLTCSPHHRFMNN